MSLCNAILGTNYDDPSELEITTLEGIFFDDRKNDISCKIRDNFLVLIEHQSSVNPNMPFRCFSYAAELLNRLVKNKRSIYRQKLIRFPSPKFYVLYDGNDDEPLEKVMRLSDSFADVKPSLELEVIEFNINYELNSPLLKKCPYLNGYSTLVGKVKQGISMGLSRRAAIIRAVKFCIEKGIMPGYLENHSEEVFSMIALEWDLNEAQKAWREDGFDEGMAKGMAEGMAKGMAEVAVNLIRMGMGFEQIQAATNLPLTKIEELAAQLKNV